MPPRAPARSAALAPAGSARRGRQHEGLAGRQRRPACRVARLGRAPGMADRRPVLPSASIQPRGRRQVLVALAQPAAPRQRIQQPLVRAAVERRQSQPLLQERQRCRRWPPAARAPSCSSTATWAARKRRRWPINQALNAALRGDVQALQQSPREQAPPASPAPSGVERHPGRPAWRRARVARRASAPVRSRRTVSPSVSTRLGAPASSSTPRSLLRHQRSSPRGSLAGPTAARTGGCAPPRATTSAR